MFARSSAARSCVVLGALFLGCGPQAKTPPAPPSVDSPDGVFVPSGSLALPPGTAAKSSDGKCQVTLLKGWTVQADLNDSAAIQVGDESNDTYLFVIAEPKNSLDAGLTLRQFGDAALTLHTDGVKELRQAPEPTEMMIGGRSALVYEFGGTASNDLPMSWILTVVEGEMSFYQILSWTFTEHMPERRTAIQQVMGSFREAS